mgnify:CR=1 FL=1
MATQLVDEDRIRLAQQLGVFGLDGAQDAHTEARPRKRMAIDHIVRQPELDPELANLVLEQFAQRFYKVKLHNLRQAADIMMRFDRSLTAKTDRLDNIRIQRPLCQELDITYSRRFGFENINKRCPDRLALLLGIIDAVEFRQDFAAALKSKFGDDVVLQFGGGTIGHPMGIQGV